MDESDSDNVRNYLQELGVTKSVYISFMKEEEIRQLGTFLKPMQQRRLFFILEIGTS